ncbi:MAG TPA: FkbM family methyltransferase [Chitinivibrionales bacterium]
MKPYLLFRMANKAYTHAFWLYRSVYGLYKKIREHDELELLRRLIKPGDTVVDIGANIGFFTEYMAKLTGANGRVLAFEPDARNFSFLLKRISKLPAVSAFNAALGDHDGAIDMYISPDLNVDHRTYPCAEQRDKRVVQCFALDSKEPAATIDFIKMDIQGHEYAALCGMKHSIARNPHCRILMELWPYGLKLAGASTGLVMDLLQSYGLNPLLIHNGKLTAFSENLVTCAETKYYTLLAAKTKP